MAAGIGLILSIMLIFPILMLWALIDLLKRPASDWDRAGQDRLIWALVVIFVGIVGPILYLAVARPKLDAIAETSFESAMR